VRQEPHRALADGHNVDAAGGHRGAKNLIAVRSPKGITPALTSLRKERLICAANENSDTRLPAITTGKWTVRSPRLGADAG
jgi:hypothetical protein